MRAICVAAVFSALLCAAPKPPLPGLKVEAADAGSALVVRNESSQPLTAYLIELVDYPGSNFALYHDVSGWGALAPGAERRVSITNMTVGAAPEYVKMQSALYADGSSAGSDEKIEQLIGLRRTALQVTRELIARLEKGKAAGKAALVAELRGWAESIAAPSKRDRGTPAALTRSTARDLIWIGALQLEKRAVEDVLAALTAAERALASSKPPL